jgi:hypothetical protein
MFKRKEKPQAQGRWALKVKERLGYDWETEGAPSMEFMADLMPPHGLERYRKMKMNDPIVGGLILQIENIMRRLRPVCKGERANEVMDMLNNLRGGISTLNYNIASAFTYGFYIGEKVYKYEDGRVTLVDIAPRYAPSITHINDAKHMVRQECSMGTFLIPYSKCVHHTVLQEAREPFGVSMLRHLYKPYYYKISIEASEAVGIDRDLTGMPVLTAPEGFNFENTDPDSPDYDPSAAATLEWALDLVSNVRKDSMSGVVKPFGWDLQIIRGSAGTNTVNTSDTVSRYNTEMAAGVLENFMALGAFATTNNANTDVTVDNFLTACDAYSEGFAQTYKEQIIKPLCELNDWDVPDFTFMPVQAEDLTDIASFFTRLINAGAITPTTTLETELMKLADFTYDPATAKPTPEK